MRIGILGGTFDPPHVGHLVIAEHALAQLRLDLVWFMPVGQPPHKQSNAISAAHHRLAMTVLAVADHARFRVSTLDLDRPPPHYTVGLLEYLRATHPLDEFVFIMGADALVDLPRWHQPQHLLELTTLAVAARPEVRVDFEALERELPGLQARLHWIQAPLVDIASSALQRLSAEGRSLRYLVPESVRAYIEAHRLYLSS
ncbi:MAG: nicotinate-nucleotide adenylyltransferase [Thermoflexales bacterium]|nr:nicotinate-nucleotide adenylyltransferase [Thermoflexales bacterium]MCS7324541.1 nicotinate-nucleotide adenylyltransferase [Thermoflexales bacterium]MDW8053745.1 nicotinate-nucleotide adenylyltransferase [Anaerolineae bacterium]MDW8292999.1 nicotinate-nucleotide adenylyltransferase [Anaerolineae bacterium]